MRIKRLTKSLISLLVIASLTSCSNINTSKPAKTKSVTKHRVEADKPLTKAEKEEYASVLDLWSKESLSKLSRPTPEKATVVKRKPVAAKRKAAVVKRKVQAKPRRVVKARPAPPRRNTNNYKAPSYKARTPVNNVRYASLTGDYASNQQANAFINKMVSRHGFDRGYMNYLLSHTKATPFLQRMAYKDAFGKRKTKTKRKPRAGRWNRYQDNFLTEKTISKGVQFWRQNRVALKRAEQMYGVPEEYILGIIGVETRYGGNVGKNRAIDALAAMGFDNPRRGKYFRSELEAYLIMTRKEGLDPLQPMASYAGALGLCQFMPSNIKRYAVDHDHSGTVNLWTPHDAIGSVANYFKKHGWQKGGTVAVRATSQNSRYKTLKTGFKSSHSLTRLKSRGVSANNLGNISGKASLIKLNTYSGDELWLGGKNFYVITRYNHSSHYAMAVHQLAEAINQRIGGKAPIRQASINSIIESLALTD